MDKIKISQLELEENINFIENSNTVLKNRISHLWNKKQKSTNQNRHRRN